jgi:hypothetical protein
MRLTFIDYTNNNSSDVASTNIDLFKSLPDIKCVDFLSSFFKAFNISVFDTHQITRTYSG